MLVAQALCMIAFLATLLPGYLDYLLRPLNCPANQWCLDFRGFTFGVYAVVLVPLASLLLAAAWLWRERRTWPAVLPIGVDLFILLAGISLVLFPSHAPGPTPSVAGEVVLILVPAIGSLIVVVALLMRRFSGKPT